MGNSKSSRHDSESSQHEYVRPNRNDARSPCPALNTLANHGYLPRDGKNINPQMLSIAIQVSVIPLNRSILSKTDLGSNGFGLVTNQIDCKKGI